MMSQKTKETSRQEQHVHGAVAVRSGGAAAQHNLRNIGLIIGREYKNRVTQRSFVITSVILLVIVFIAAFIPTIVQLITARAPTLTHMVVVNNAGAVAGLNDTALLSYIKTELNGTNTTGHAPYTITSQPSAHLGRLHTQVTQGQVDILLVLERTPSQDVHFTYDTDASATDDSNQSTIQALAQLLTFLDTAHRLGLTAHQTQRLATPPDMTIMYARQSQQTLPASEMAAGFIFAYASAILIYFCVGVYAGIVAAGVAEEKSSRMMEILVNAATPFQLLAGKIVGIGAACLTQMSCLVVVGIGALLLQTPLQTMLFGASAGDFARYLTGLSIPFYLLFLLYVLLAFFLYVTLFAGLSALVRRQEEVQSANALPQVLMISGYLLFFFAVFSPNATVTKVLSYIPFWTPWVMMARIARGTVAWWEIGVTAVLMMVTILICVRFAARLYRYGVLMYGQRPGLRHLLALIWMR
jgi:ABC-2 type transport system permease protein